MEVTTREALEIAVSWVVPGFILSVIFRLFVPFLRWGRDEAVLGYLSIGSVFAALRLFGVPTPLTTFLLPALLGLLLGVVTYRYRRLISHLLPLPPTAWDAAFWRRLEPCLGTELEFVIMVIAVSCVKLLSAHNSTQHTSRKHKV